mmetsp:Transcript_80939/g.212474  ORF Transcript_80939/g.212474 Transcript_80939/m.212474 type:complete len:401 (-) Transcript_80939:190-1392(-)
MNDREHDTADVAEEEDGVPRGDALDDIAAFPGPSAAEGDLEHGPQSLARRAVVLVHPQPRLFVLLFVLDEVLEGLTQEEGGHQHEGAEDNHGPEQACEAGQDRSDENAQRAAELHGTDEPQGPHELAVADDADEAQVSAPLPSQLRDDESVHGRDDDDASIKEVELVQEEVATEVPKAQEELHEEDGAEEVLEDVERQLGVGPAALVRFPHLDVEQVALPVQLGEGDDRVEGDKDACADVDRLVHEPVNSCRRKRQTAAGAVVAACVASSSLLPHPASLLAFGRNGLGRLLFRQLDLWKRLQHVPDSLLPLRVELLPRRRGLRRGRRGVCVRVAIGAAARVRGGGPVLRGFGPLLLALVRGRLTDQLLHARLDAPHRLGAARLDQGEERLRQLGVFASGR